MRESKIIRKTNETDIKLSLNLDGTGVSEIKTGIGFFDHMLTLFAKHGRFDLNVKCIGDMYVDGHHSVEDIGICLGKAFDEALSDRRGITRYSHIILPMDEALVLCAVDIGGRSFLSFDLDVNAPMIGEYDTELTEEFMRAFTDNSKICLHIKKLSGKNAHHIIEACFKALARTLADAVKINADSADEIPSTKGIL